MVCAQHGWWFPEEGPPDYGWKRSNVNLLFGDLSGYDPETGAEALRCSLCRVYPVESTRVPASGAAEAVRTASATAPTSAERSRRT